jgi:uncharacterized protein (UPF0276 family)
MSTAPQRVVMAGALAAADVGIGLRQPHYAEVLEQTPPLGFVEVHSENFFADGGAALGVLQQARAAYAVSLHGVGLALGSAAGVDAWHLERLERLVRRIEPVRVSDHACFARAALAAGRPVVHGNDLLPIAFTPASLDILVANVTQVQERLRRPMLVENLSAYLSFRSTDGDAAWAEPHYFAELCRRSGCSMLLDVNNLMVNALNAQGPRGAQREVDGAEGFGAAIDAAVRTCCDYIDALAPGSVGEVHLAGYCVSDASDAGNGLVIDDHGSRVRPWVWAVYEHALRRFGPLPTLVEWDTDLPALDVLLGEARQAAGRLAAVGQGAPR